MFCESWKSRGIFSKQGSGNPGLGISQFLASGRYVSFCLCRLHVVSVRWLVDCLTQARTVNEADYICFDTAPDAAPATASATANRFGPWGSTAQI